MVIPNLATLAKPYTQSTTDAINFGFDLNDRIRRDYLGNLNVPNQATEIDRNFQRNLFGLQNDANVLPLALDTNLATARVGQQTALADEALFGQIRPLQDTANVLGEANNVFDEQSRVDARAQEINNIQLETQYVDLINSVQGDPFSRAAQINTALINDPNTSPALVNISNIKLVQEARNVLNSANNPYITVPENILTSARNVLINSGQFGTPSNNITPNNPNVFDPTQ